MLILILMDPWLCKHAMALGISCGDHPRFAKRLITNLRASDQRGSLPTSTGRAFLRFAPSSVLAPSSKARSP